jgi:hypothetical protein
MIEGEGAPPKTEQLMVRVHDVARERKWTCPESKREQASLRGMFCGGQLPDTSSSSLSSKDLLMYSAVRGERPSNVKCSLLRRLHKQWRARLAQTIPDFIEKASIVNELKAKAEAAKDPSLFVPHKAELLAHMAELTPRSKESVTLLQQFGKYESNVHLPSEWLVHELNQCKFDPRMIEIMVRAALPSTLQRSSKQPAKQVSLSRAWKAAVRVFNESRVILWSALSLSESQQEQAAHQKVKE